MRAGVCSVQQALTAEVTSVLKHSLNLARRRGHAQVTPLHVAATLICSSAASSDLLRRACLKSHPHHLASHPLQCRALELCFNVALNRLPATSPPSSSPFLPSPYSLSNSLIAALKRAQANLRKGCIELQQQQLQQQPLLAINKVGIEQLMLSILDDPSVSRVMKEAGFSSSCVKNNLEEEATALSQSSPFLWQSPPQNEDLGMLVEVMSRRANTVVVGDSTPMTQGLASELMRMLERSEATDELKRASFMNLQFSYGHLRVMSKGEVEGKVSDLRRTINSLGSDNIIIYAGDLSWAVDEEGRGGRGFNPVEHMVEEMGRLLRECKSSNENKVWLLAIASYRTYMRCQKKQPSLEALWDLQAVMVPSGWLALSPQASCGLVSKESTVLSSKEEDQLVFCQACTLNFEKEALDIKSKAACWLQGNPEGNDKGVVLELKRKWKKLCQSLHRDQAYLWPPFFNQNPIGKTYSKSTTNSWWPTSLFFNQDKSLSQPHLLSCSQKLNTGFSSTVSDKQKEKGNNPLERVVSQQWSSEASLNSLKLTRNHQVMTSLSLATPLSSDSATSKDQTRKLVPDPIDLQHQLQEEIPWQSNTIPSIVKAIHEIIHSDKRAIHLLIRGSDNIAKRRIAMVVAKFVFGSQDKLIQIKQRTSPAKDISCLASLKEALRKDQTCVVLVEDIDQMHPNFIKSFTCALKIGYFEDTFGREVSAAGAIFILTTSTSNSAKFDEPNGSVMMMRFCSEDSSKPSDIKRKSECDLQNRSKKRRAGDHCFDLNSQADEDSEDAAAPSDLTHETQCVGVHLPQELLESTAQLTVNAGCGHYQEMKVNLLSKLHRAFQEVISDKDDKGHLFIDPAVADELMEASGYLLESLFENWVRDVFKMSLESVKKSGNLRLKLEGKKRTDEEFSFLGSVLPNRILVE